MAHELYAVTRGCYSDYTIIALTTDKVRAEQLRKMHSNSYNEAKIETFEDGIPNDWYTPHRFWRIYLSEDGSEFSVEEYWDKDWYDDIDVVKTRLSNGLLGYEIEKITADSRDKALKIARDRTAARIVMENML